METLLNITPDTSQNTAGLDMVFFCPEEAVKTWPAADGLVMRGDLELHDGEVFYIMGYTRHTPAYEEQHKPDRRGGLYTIEQKGHVPTDTPVLGNQLFTMAGRRYVLLIRDRNGFLRITPPGYPCQFSYNLTKGTRPDNRHGYNIAFETEAPVPALYYSGSFEVSELGLVQPPTSGGGGDNSEPIRVRYNGTIIKLVNPGEILEVTSPYSLEFDIRFA